MNAPPLLLGATLLFWGWQTGFLPLAAIIAVLLEGARFTRARWEFSQADLDRLWNCCILLFLAAAAYAFAAGDGTGSTSQKVARFSPATLTRTVRAVFLFFQWMPLYFIPIMAAQAWGQQDKMALSTFSWWLRQQRRPRESAGRGTLPSDPVPQEGGLNITFLYFGLCLLGASAARARSPWFLAGLLLLLGWAFWSRRRRSVAPVAWIASLLAAAVLGAAVQQGLVHLEAALQKLDNALVARFSQDQGLDVRETRTMLGVVGNLKLSGRIVLRVKSGDQPPPSLLREASYNVFKSPVWGSYKREFHLLFSDDEQTWSLVTNQDARSAVMIACLLPGGKGVLALPQGVAVLERLPVYVLQANRLGTLRSEEGPGFVEFTARYGPGAAIDAPPGPDDLQVPAAEEPALARIADELKLGEKNNEDAVNTLAAFFSRHFEYSSWLGNEPFAGPGRTPLSEFLLSRRKGHCEYFATATTLLLRQAGIPARYAIGYAVQERKGGEYVVRARHGHAWCLAWLNGAWREIDNTPGSWVAVEAGRASAWELLSDGWSRVTFAFSRWRSGPSQWRKYLVWLVVLPLLAMTARLFSARGWRLARRRTAGPPAPDLRAGLDSAFYLVERRLAQLGLGRQPGETACDWLQRVTRSGVVSTLGLDYLLALHYQLRFDPAGLSSAGRSTLDQGVREWLNALERQGRDAKSVF